jgi:hypothetical protein
LEVAKGMGTLDLKVNQLDKKPDYRTEEEMKVFPAESALSTAFSSDGSQLTWEGYSGIIHLAGLLKE